MAAPQTTNKYRQRWTELQNERSTWMPHWQEISEYLLPRSGRFFLEDRNKGQKKYNSILDSTGTDALDVLVSGSQSIMASPARPWFRHTTGRPELDESANVKLWLSKVTRLMQMVFQKSNTYLAMSTMYEELGAFGTSVSIVLPDFKNVIHHHVLTIGEFAIATDYKGNPDTLYREFQMTVAQIVDEFGIENVSENTRNAHIAGRLGQWVTVLHAIEPRKDRDATRIDSKNMPWASVYFELGDNSEKLLREGGFRRFPCLIPRWIVRSGNVYGNSPAMSALGDIKQLQHEQLRKAQGIDYMTKPPLQAPSGMKNREIDTLPGGVSFVDQVGAGNGIRTAFDTRLDLNHLLADIVDVRERIRARFFANVFLMLSGNTDTRLTATEAAMRNEEKMLLLGPVGGRMQSELHGPLIELTFDYMVDAGIVPPAPEELQGAELSVEFVSVFAQAQRAVATNSVDRFLLNLGQVAQFKPEVLDKLDADRWADEYADMLGVNPELVVPGDKVEALREARAQAQAAQAQAEQAEQMASTAQKLGTVQTPTGNAGNDIMQALTGYTTGV
jgi:hypothetical protein